jgi:hypothetical protein
MPARLRAEMTIVNAETDPRTEAARRAIGDMQGTTVHDRARPWVEFPTTSAIVTMTIRRWTLPDDRETLHAAIDSGGVAAVVQAMKGLPALGDLYIGGERVTIRVAATWMTEHTQRVRLVFATPMRSPGAA